MFIVDWCGGYSVTWYEIEGWGKAPLSLVRSLPSSSPRGEPLSPGNCKNGDRIHLSPFADIQ